MRELHHDETWSNLHLQNSHLARMRELHPLSSPVVFVLATLTSRECASCIINDKYVIAFGDLSPRANARVASWYYSGFYRRSFSLTSRECASCIGKDRQNYAHYAVCFYLILLILASMQLAIHMCRCADGLLCQQFHVRTYRQINVYLLFALTLPSVTIADKSVLHALLGLRV